VSLLVVGSFFPILISAIGFMLRPSVVGNPPRLREAVWMLSPLLWALLAVGYARPDPWLRGIAVGIVVSTPCWHLLLALTLGRWLLWPFHFRDLAASGVPPRQRRLLGLLAATLVLPGGGLATPLWLCARSRLGRGEWPRARSATQP
jgi:hypothetical protein